MRGDEDDRMICVSVVIIDCVNIGCAPHTCFPFTTRYKQQAARGLAARGWPTARGCQRLAGYTASRRHGVTLYVHGESTKNIVFIKKRSQRKSIGFRVESIGTNEKSIGFIMKTKT